MEESEYYAACSPLLEASSSFAPFAGHKDWGHEQNQDPALLTPAGSYPLRDANTEPCVSSSKHLPPPATKMKGKAPSENRRQSDMSPHYAELKPTQEDLRRQYVDLRRASQPSGSIVKSLCPQHNQP